MLNSHVFLVKTLDTSNIRQTIQELLGTDEFEYKVSDSVPQDVPHIERLALAKQAESLDQNARYLTVRY